MKLDDLLVEVRDASLRRVGALLARDIELEATVPARGIGAWTVRLDASHPLAEALAEPGAGVIVSDSRLREPLFSGPTTSPLRTLSAQEGGVAQIEIAGITDDHVLADRLCSVDPAATDISTSIKVKYDVSGSAEEVIHHLVDVNTGESATAERRVVGLRAVGNLQRGAAITRSLKFENLLEVIGEIAKPEGLYFRVVQRDDRLEFSTWQAVDRNREVRLSVRNGRLSETQVQIEPPTVTRAIVAAEEKRAGYLEVTQDAAVLAEGQWGRRIESYTVGGSKKTAELLKAGQEALQDGGQTNIASQATAVDHEHLVYLRDWNVGDVVTVEVTNQELTSEITGFRLVADQANGFQFGIVLGDASGFDLSAIQNGRISNTEFRVGKLERLVSNVDDLRPVGEVTMFYGPKASIPDGWLALDGSSINQSLYPALYALVGGVLPNMTDRMAIGAGGKPIGTTGGSDSVTLSSANLPAHSHAAGTLAAASGGAHTHPLGIRGVSTGNATGTSARITDINGAFGGGANTHTANTTSAGAHGHTITGSTANAGTGTAFSVQNPYVALWYIIRAA